MKVVVIEPLGVPMDAVQTLRESLPAGSELVYYEDRAASADELVRRGRDAEVIVVANQPLDAEAIQGFTRLRMLSVAFTGCDHVDLEACRKKGVTVSNCAGYSTAAVADLVFGMVIGLYRSLPECDARTRMGGTREGLIGPELEGKTFGVVGMGAIGQRVARIAQAFGCKVLAYSRTVRELPGVCWTSLDAVLEQSDIVSLHVPLNASSRGMIGEKELAKMKKSAVLINTSRGPVVDSAALANALNQGRIAGCGIDVFETEPPLQDHPLFHAPHVMLAPHIGFATKEALMKRAKIAFANISAWDGGTPQNRVI